MMNRARLLRMNPPCGETRREFLWEAGGGFAGMALTSMLSADGFFGATRADDSLRPKASHQARPTKACICLFMYGGPSQVDLFDPKPMLTKYHGKTMPGIDKDHLFKVRNPGKLLGSSRQFLQHGESDRKRTSLNSRHW